MKGVGPIEIALRIGVFGTYLGHGILTFSLPEKWIGYLGTVGFSVESAKTLLPIIGIIDICVAVVVLLKPHKYVVLWAFIWALATALMRPISGEHFLELIERSANFMLPLALYFYLLKSKGRVPNS